MGFSTDAKFVHGISVITNLERPPVLRGGSYGVVVVAVSVGGVEVDVSIVGVDVPVSVEAIVVSVVVLVSVGVVVVPVSVGGGDTGVDAV